MLWGGRQGHGNFVAACDLTVPARASETVTPFPFPGEAWMPWKECSVMDERLRFVARLLDGEAMSEVCRAFGISRKTGYKIFDHIWQQSGADKKGKGRRGARFAPDSPLEESGFELSVPLGLKTPLGHAFRRPTLCGSN